MRGRRARQQPRDKVLVLQGQQKGRCRFQVFSYAVRHSQAREPAALEQPCCAMQLCCAIYKSKHHHLTISPAQPRLPATPESQRAAGSQRAQRRCCPPAPPGPWQSRRWSGAARRQSCLPMGGGGKQRGFYRCERYWRCNREDGSCSRTSAAGRSGAPSACLALIGAIPRVPARPRPPLNSTRPPPAAAAAAGASRLACCASTTACPSRHARLSECGTTTRCSCSPAGRFAVVDATQAAAVRGCCCRPLQAGRGTAWLGNLLPQPVPATLPSQISVSQPSMHD